MIIQMGTPTYYLTICFSENCMKMVWEGLPSPGFANASSGVDPGLLIGEGANPPRGGGGVPTYDFAKLSEKLHKIEKISGRWGGGGG